jgi:hypothetical protein
MILGHFTGTYIVVKILKPRASPFLMAAAITGAYFPDMVDKTLMLFHFGGGRFIAHSLPLLSLFLFFVFCFFSFHKELTNHKPLLGWFCAGCYLHLLQDMVQLKILFWPFLGSLERPPSKSIMTIIKNYYSFKSSVLIWPEIVLHILFILTLAISFFKKNKQTKI